MISQENFYAMLGMCAVVITLYALKSSNTHWLPDIFGLILAMATPRPTYAIGAVVVLAIIRHTPLARGLSESVPDWLLVVVLPGAVNMSRWGDEYSDAELAYKERILGGNSNNEMDEIPQPVAETDNESITFGETRALARLVAAGTIGLTEAVKIGAGAVSGKRYQQRSRLIKAEVDRLKNHYPANSNLKRFE